MVIFVILMNNNMLIGVAILTICMIVGLFITLCLFHCLVVSCCLSVGASTFECYGCYVCYSGSNLIVSQVILVN